MRSPYAESAMKSKDDTLSVTEAGQAGRWSYPQVVRLLMTGELTGAKRDGRWRIDVDSVDRLLASGATTLTKGRSQC